MKEQQRIVIGIDIGTSSAKAIAYTRDGRVIGNAQKSYPLLQNEPGSAEQDPEQIMDAVIDCLNHVMQETTGKAKVTAISVSAAMHGVMALDIHSRPLTHIITWADTRSIQEAEEIRRSDDAAIIYDRTGIPIHPMSPLCKLRWLHRHRWRSPCA